MSERVVLSYHDSLLYASDTELLRDNRWLNDKIIGFAFEYFEREQFALHADQFCFITPDVTQFIKCAEGPEVGVFLEPLNLHMRRYVFLAVNNNANTQEAGGSHWSLLVYNRDYARYQHYDSYGGCNISAAVNVAGKIHSYLEPGNPATNVTVQAADCPQQTNSCDCGVYVISYTEHLCRQYLLGHDMPLSTAVTPSSVSAKRSELGELIQRLAVEQTS